MNKKIIIIQISLVILLITTNCFAQTKKSDGSPKTKVRYFEIGLGLPSITLRDRLTTALAYTGIGLANIHIANTKQDGNKMFTEFNTNTSIMSAKPAIENLPTWNKSASIFSFHFLYRKLKGIAESRNKQWHYFAGASLSSNGQVAIIPSANNSLAYNFNWLQAGLEGMIKRDFTWKRKYFQFTYQASLPIMGLTVRPQSYIGLLPQSTIWAQNQGTFTPLFYQPKFSSLHNNFIFRNDISLDIRLRKSKLRLQYIWQFTSNKVAVNSLNSVVSSINLIYLIKLKNK